MNSLTSLHPKDICLLVVLPVSRFLLAQWLNSWRSCRITTRNTCHDTETKSQKVISMEPPVYVPTDESLSSSGRHYNLGAFLVWRIRDQDRVFVLNSPLLLEYSQEGKSTWKCAERTLEIECYGRSRNEAFSRFSVKFSILWDEIVSEEDDQLTPKAVALKRRMRAVVVTVKEGDIGTVTSQETTQTTDSQGIRTEIWEAGSHNLLPAYQWA